MAQLSKPDIEPDTPHKQDIKLCMQEYFGLKKHICC